MPRSRSRSPDGRRYDGRDRRDTRRYDERRRNEDRTEQKRSEERHRRPLLRYDEPERDPPRTKEHRPRVIEREFYTVTEEQKQKQKQEQESKVDAKQPEEEQDEMLKMLGFSGFGTTKGKKVEDKEQGVADTVKRHSYRQYMNRKGGFNQLLDKID